MNNLRKIKKEKMGYTMIEILVVISIIGFMLSVAMYLLTSSRENARLARAKEFASIVNGKLGSSLIGWWALDEGSGNNANDGWAKNDGCKGSVGSVTWPSGIFGKALSFSSNATFDFPVISGCGGALVRGNLSPPITSSDITITAWFKTTSVGTILALGGSGACFTDWGGVGLDNTAGSDQGKVVAPDSSSEVRGNKDYRDDKWHFVAVKMGSSGVQIWVDGALDGSSSTNTVNVSSNTYMRLGGGTGCHWGAFSTGTIDDVKLYNESLTAQEIQKYYTESANKYQVAIK